MTRADATQLSVDEEASETFIQREYGEWTRTDQQVLEKRLVSDAAYALAYRRIEDSWRAMGAHAESPEVLAYREQAIAIARKENARRWLKTSPVIRARWRFAAAAASVTFVLISVWFLFAYGDWPGRYSTDIAEQRMIELEDHSRVALDATTRIQVSYSPDSRVVELQHGQAQFTVAPDPARPFKVLAGDHAIVALGTVFTVEYVDEKVHIAMMEGRVAVVPSNPARTHFIRPLSLRKRGEEKPPYEMDSNPSSRLVHASSSHAERIEVRSQPVAEVKLIELTAGEELRVSQAGQATFVPKADLEAATAWREGKVIFRAEPLSDAVRRMNRYSRVQIEIQDEALANRRIYGVFDAGDTQGFVSALRRYLPISVDTTDSDTVRLTRQ